MRHLGSKLAGYRALTEGERSALGLLPSQQRGFNKGDVLTVDGAPRPNIYVVGDGVVQEHRMLQGGGQQIVALHLPGDIIGLSALLSGVARHGLSALTRISVAQISDTAILTLIAEQPALGRLLWRDMARDAAISQEWLVSMGRRTALGRTAHLMCELFVRFSAVDAVEKDRCAFPLTQGELADALGLSVVHVNRVLQKLRGDDLIAVQSGRLIIKDWSGLAETAGFDPTYLGPFDAARFTAA